jgi:hypothetical protein
VHVVLHAVVLARGGGNIVELHFCGALRVSGYDFHDEKLRLSFIGCMILLKLLFYKIELFPE